MMDRRTFVGAVATTLLSRAGTPAAQTPRRVYRLGILVAAAPFASDQPTRIPQLLQRLGYVEGDNLVVARHYADRKLDKLPGLARDLVERRMDVILAIGNTPLRAARDATATIPIVMVTSGDPVAAGFAASLARPGGNVTGVLITAEGTLAAKRLEFLKQAVPGATRIALLTPDDPAVAAQVREAQRAAPALGVTLFVVPIQGDDYDRAFTTMLAARVQALFVAASPNFGGDRKRIIELAAVHRLPAMHEWREQVVEGGLMIYGSSLQATYQRAAEYIDRIFKGAYPGEMPIEQPTRFELVINLKVASALGITIPQPLVLRADELIQ